MWGFDGSYDTFCEKAQKDGYDGAEFGWTNDAKQQQELFTAAKKHGIKVGFITSAGNDDYETHFANFKKNIDNILSNPYQKPIYINCHSGHDYFTFEQNQGFIDYTLAKSKESGVPIYHETHRSRMLYSAPIAHNFAVKNPDLRITLDISHWCVVHESLLANQKDTVDYMLNRTNHIHARIGHPEGPQVSEPRAPEWDNAVKAHLAWWDKVIERKKRNGETITILTEFGPPDYMPTLPYTRLPVADQWEINVYMMNLLRKRYQ
jgi:sugar phosphate isomerase/epimerase